jgi:hypothetical protein
MPKLSIPLPDKLKKNGFWIAIGVLALAMTVIWFAATSSVAGSREQNIKKVGAIDLKIKGITPTTNDEQNLKLATTNKARKSKLEATWTASYQRQAKELTWPTRQIGPMGKVVRLGLPDEFITAVKQLPPPERLRKPPLDDLRPELKEIYKNFAKSQIKDLCDIIDASYRIEEKTAKGAASSGSKDKGDDRLQSGETVIWLQGSQLDAQDLLTFPEGGNPSTQEILYAQENLWVYQTLFKIVQRTNASLKEGSAKDKVELAHYNAPVKIIRQVLVGSKYAAPAPAVVEGLEKVSDAPKEDVPVAEGKEGEAAEPISPMLNSAGKRYVDAKGAPLKGAALAALGKSASFKRMPVYMQLEVDQRYLGRLLAECANSPLTVEVKQVGFKTDGHAERVASAKPDTAAQGQPGDKSEGKPNFYDLTVEIVGHIYIFYPPMADKPDDAAAEGEPVDNGAPTSPAKTPAAGG